MKVLIALLCLLGFSSLSIGQDLEKSWKEVLKGCGRSDIIGKETLFFGPSNTIGLGSVWRQTEKKGYNPRFELADLISDSAQLAKIIRLGSASEQCVTVRNVSWSAGAALPFLGKIFGLTGVDVNLHKARKTSVSVDNLVLDVIKEVPFEEAIRSILKNDPGNAYLNDLLKNRDRLLVTKAYRIRGMVVKMEYDPKILEELKTRYANGSTVQIGGEKGLNVEFNFNADSELILKLPSDVYIACEFSKVSETGTIKYDDENSFKLSFTEIRKIPGAKIGMIEPVK